MSPGDTPHPESTRTLQNETTIHDATPAEHAEAQAFYAACGYGGAAIQPTDRVVLARSDGQIVGVGRLSDEGGAWCLRGMQVAPSFRGSGIGRRVLDTLVVHMQNAACWCLPYTHLAGFYGRAGFEQRHANMPGHLQSRLDRYRARGMDVIAMWRPAPTTTNEKGSPA